MSEFDECMVLLNIKLQGIEIDVGNFMVIVKFAMEVVECTQLKGMVKRNW